jgi:hypothetical protein
MGAAEELNSKLVSFREPEPNGRTSQQRLLEYCSTVLSSVERMHFDYKEKRDRRLAKLDPVDQVNVAVTLSGFANSVGGVAIWGIDDGSLQPKPIANIRDFAASIQKAAPLWTDPPVLGIVTTWIPSDVDPEQGFALLYVPESLLPPHRVILKDQAVQNRYFVRSGEAFVVASHAQLEDMFGRRPKPLLQLNPTVTYKTVGADIMLDVLLGIENTGRGVARAPFLTVRVEPPYEVAPHGIDGMDHFGLDPLPTAPELKESCFGASSDRVIHPGVVLDVARLRVTYPNSQTPMGAPELLMVYKLAAEGVQAVERRLHMTSHDIFLAIGKAR